MAIICSSNYKVYVEWMRNELAYPASKAESKAGFLRFLLSEILLFFQVIRNQTRMSREHTIDPSSARNVAPIDPSGARTLVPQTII
jgi:hypothetical protein